MSQPGSLASLAGISWPEGVLGRVAPQEVDAGGLGSLSIPLPVQSSAPPPPVVRPRKQKRNPKEDLWASILSKTASGFGVPGAGNIPWAMAPQEVQQAAQGLIQSPIGWSPSELTGKELAMFRHSVGEPGWDRWVNRQRDILGDPSWNPSPKQKKAKK